MELINIIEEYDYHCLAKGFTKKTMINKRQELKQMRIFLQEKRGIKKVEKVFFYCFFVINNIKGV